MRKSEMTDEQVKNRSFFVDTLAKAGWQGSNFNQKFDRGLWASPEASMEYSNPAMDLRLDFVFEDPRIILYLDSKEGRTLGLVFKCEDRLKPLLDAVVGMQNTIGPGNIKAKSEDLLAACPKMFKISASGDKLVPVKPKRSR
jgi:hypothetical protein